MHNYRRAIEIADTHRTEPAVFCCFRRCVLLLAVTILILSGRLPAHATFTGLVQIPTADLIPPSTHSIELELDSSLRPWTANTRYINTEFGVSNCVEVGLDLSVSSPPQPNPLLNVKYVTIREGAHNPAVAVGVFNAGPSRVSSSYVVATKNLKAFRGHIGMMDTGGHDRWFAGIDKAVSKRMILMADHISGEANYSAVGFFYQFSRESGVLAGMLFPNSHSGSTILSLHFIFTGSLARRSKEY